MKIDNKIGNGFGRAPVFAGGLFFLVGFVLMLSKAFLPGFLTFLASSFVLFSSSGVEIDTEKGRIRQYNKLFGLVKTGHWKTIHSYLGVTVVPFTRTESMASWSNRTNFLRETDYRIYMVNKARKPAFAIKKCKTPQEARDSLDEFSIWLKLPVFSAKR